MINTLKILLFKQTYDKLLVSNIVLLLSNLKLTKSLFSNPPFFDKYQTNVARIFFLNI